MSNATLENIKRKSVFVDCVQKSDAGIILPSSIDINITELCNRSAGSKRACSFCPRIDASVYPNQNLHMPLSLADKIASELRALQYTGVVLLCGFGEPLLHPRIISLAQMFYNLRVEVVTNGDRLSVEMIKELYRAGVSHVVVNLYDSNSQVQPVIDRFDQAGINRSEYTIRDRWHGAEHDFGLKLTNRAGAVTAGNQPEVDKAKPCYYLAYSMIIDWNGDVLMCVQDWSKKTRFGNVGHRSLLEIWSNSQMTKRRKALAAGDRSANPCNNCNVNGTMHGVNHVSAWEA